jgi:hypothetical protein
MSRSHSRVLSPDACVHLCIPEACAKGMWIPSSILTLFSPFSFAGQLGRTLSEGSSVVPWYAYAMGAVGFSLLAKVIADAANRAIAELEEDNV